MNGGTRQLPPTINHARLQFVHLARGGSYCKLINHMSCIAAFVP